jgi:hypothetical protein
MAPAALIAAPVSGISSRLQPSRRAMKTELSPAAPPPPISTALAGSMPWLTVSSSIA